MNDTCLALYEILILGKIPKLIWISYIHYKVVAETAKLLWKSLT